MKNLFKALAEFQQEVPAIHEGTKGYSYTYADLKTIFRVINPILAKHNLGFTQLLEGTNIKTIIFHTESGETLETITEIPQGIELKGMNSFQVAGSSYTYFRRYALSSILGLVTDVDSDATGEEVKQEEVKKPKLNSGRFGKALEAVKTGEFDAQDLIDKYELTEKQLEDLNKILA
jgi:hypothetical protein